MSKSRSGVHHRIDYIEFTVADLAVAKAFYGAVFGWQFQDYGPGYAGIQGDGREVGGLTVGTPKPGGALVVIYTDDLAASEAAVVAGGGQITTPTFSFPGGQRFQFADPSGNELACWRQG
ncbi:MAG: putative enzyme related to lactoylglutathione lyase [Myxococcota bacterium]|jgi:predicted enzyme related to lactoylglutathione lyase